MEQRETTEDQFQGEYHKEKGEKSAMEMRTQQRQCPQHAGRKQETQMLFQKNKNLKNEGHTFFKETQSSSPQHRKF